MKKALCALVVAVLISSCCQLVGSLFSDVWVDDTYPVNEDIDGDQYFRTIVAALAAVESGGTVHVAAGTYSEKITINKSNVTLQSISGAAVTIIDFTGIWCGYWSTGNGGVDIPYGVEGVTVEGFTVLGGSPASDALISIGGDDNTIRNNIVIGDPTSAGQDIGIHIGDVAGTAERQPSGNKIVGNEVYDHAGSGIFVGNWAGINNIISGNNVHDNVIGGIPTLNGNGIEVDRALGVSVRGNTIHNNEVAGVRVVRTAPNAAVDINRNTITDNGNGVQSDNWRPGATTSAVVVINCNNIVNNTGFGVLHTEAVVINAKTNWWGSASGPYHLASNPGGTGDPVSDNVDFAPWGQILNPCASRSSQGANQPTFGEQICPLAEHNIAKAEDMLDTVQELLHDAQAFALDVSEVEELLHEAVRLLEEATIFCKYSQNCIAGNTLAIEAQNLLEEAQELLESMIS